MSLTFEQAKHMQGYRVDTQRSSCSNCTHRLSSGQCGKGGFFTKPFSVCLNHEKPTSKVAA